MRRHTSGSSSLLFSRPRVRRPPWHARRNARGARRRAERAASGPRARPTTSPVIRRRCARATSTAANRRRAPSTRARTPSACRGDAAVRDGLERRLLDLLGEEVTVTRRAVEDPVRRSRPGSRATSPIGGSRAIGMCGRLARIASRIRGRSCFRCPPWAMNSGNTVTAGAPSRDQRIDRFLERGRS